MKIVFRVSVKGGTASAEKMPVISEGSRGVVYLAAAFDEEWQNIPVKKLTLWREGETMLQFLLDDTGEVLLPEVFTLSEKPFYLRFAGEDGDFSLQTNSLCASFGELRAPAEDQPSFTVYTGSYTLTENGVYPMENKVLTEDLTVDVFTVDTTKDTVTPETLHQGITAHDAAGKPIEGTYVNPYNANTEGDTVVCRGEYRHLTRPCPHQKYPCRQSGVHHVFTDAAKELRDHDNGKRRAYHGNVERNGGGEIQSQ